MEPIKNWNNVKPIGGEKQQLPAGGYVCKIIGAKTVLNRKNRQMLEVYVDIAHDDEYNGFFMDRYKDQADREKWPNAATIRINLPANTDTPEDYEKMAGRVKKFIQDVEESNTPYVFAWDEKTLKGKLVGCLFGREEFETQDRTRAWATKVFYTTTIANIQTGNFKTPKDRPIREQMQTYYSAPEAAVQDFQQMEQGDVDEDLPF